MQDQLTGSCFITGALATVPRLYHGVATLIASGAIWTGGTNPQVRDCALCKGSPRVQAEVGHQRSSMLLHSVKQCS